jgi:hypothetical protein
LKTTPARAKAPKARPPARKHSSFGRRASVWFWTIRSSWFATRPAIDRDRTFWVRFAPARQARGRPARGGGALWRGLGRGGAQLGQNGTWFRFAELRARGLRALRWAGWGVGFAETVHVLAFSCIARSTGSGQARSTGSGQARSTGSGQARSTRCARSGEAPSTISG